MAQSETLVNYYFVRDLKQQVQPPESGMVSHTLHDDDATKIILFGFAPTHELAPHKAAMPATMQFLSGEAEVILGDDKQQAGPGTLIHMQPQLTHGVLARTPVLMLLTLHKSARRAS